jgi:hypothetical protein
VSEPIKRTPSEALLEQRAVIEKIRLTTSRDRDKMLLIVAGGSLGVSVTFLERVITDLTNGWAIALMLGWACEVTAIVYVLLSLHSSDAAMICERERVDAMLKSDDGKDPGWPNPAAVTTEWRNKMASILMVVGLVIILAHAAISLTLESKRVPESSPAGEGASSPSR